jgi:glyoxylate/hydroxypyruvate reductase A
VLAQSDILICLLPLTDATRGLLRRETFAQMPRGAGLINLGRGGHLVQQDLLDALDSGQLSAAVLDVTSPEPLPQGHPLYAHPRVILTPHVSAMTHPETAVEAVLANLRRRQGGAPMRGLVPRDRGY